MINYKDQYRLMHNKHPLVFAGNSVLAHITQIHELINWVRGPVITDQGLTLGDMTVRMLDFGCGKGHQYSHHKIHNVWSIPTPFRYDIGVKEFRVPIPKDTFDCAICTDVMEHIAEPDIDGILTTIFESLKQETVRPRFVFFSISCRPAKKFFDDGTNVHLTIQPPEWWHNRISAFKINNGRVIVHCS